MKISATKTKFVATCGKKLLRAGIVIDDTIFEEVADFVYLGNMISEFNTDFSAIKRHFGKNIFPTTKLQLYNITSKAALKYCSEVWVLNKKECQQYKQQK
jgi:hypothetical protein